MNRRWPAAALLLAIVLFSPLAFARVGEGSDSFLRFLQEHGKPAAVAASFGFGFLASLTPCVFPMVPITVSIFGAGVQVKSRSRGAALSATFALGIAALFTPMGVASALSGRLMGSMLSNAYVVVALAILFAALASSMFGLF